MRVYLTSEFLKALTGSDPHTIKKVLILLKKLEQNPESGKPLKYEHRNHRSVRVKPYRIIYRIEDDIINMVSLKHRKDAY